MWLSGQYKRPAEQAEGQTGVVTVGGGGTAVLLDRERRGLEVYGPGGYRWTPEPGQRALVIQGQGEIPCVAGVRQGGGTPGHVSIGARSVSVSGQSVSLQDGVDLKGSVSVNGVPLEEYIARIVAGLLGGLG